jgi:hypothetical protein
MFSSILQYEANGLVYHIQDVGDMWVVLYVMSVIELQELYQHYLDLQQHSL